MNPFRSLTESRPAQSSISPELQADIDIANDYLKEEGASLQERIAQVNAPDTPLTVEDVMPITIARGELRQMVDAVGGLKPDLFLIETLNRAREASGDKAMQGINREDTARKAGVIVIQKRIALALMDNTPDSDGSYRFSKPRTGIDGQKVDQTITPKPLERGTDVYDIKTTVDKDNNQSTTEHKLSVDWNASPVSADLSELTNPGNKARPIYRPLASLSEVWRANNSLIIPNLPKY